MKLTRNRVVIACCAMLAFSVLLFGAVIGSYFDLTIRSATSVPVSGNARIYVDSSTSLLTCLLHSGASCITPPAQVLIQTQSPTSTGTVTFSSIPQSYSDLTLMVRGASTAAATFVQVNMTVNADSGANYDNQSIVYQNSTSTSISAVAQNFEFIGWIPASTGVANAGSECEVLLSDYKNTTFQKSFLVRSTVKTANTTAGTFIYEGGGFWRSTAAVNSVTVTLASGNFVSGSTVSLYGRN